MIRIRFAKHSHFPININNYSYNLENVSKPY